MKHTNTEEVLRLLREAGGQQFAEEDVKKQGNELILPENMTEQEGIKFLTQVIRSKETEMNFRRDFKFRPWDGALATMRALKAAFGATLQKGVPGFFGETPPALITIPTGVNETEQVPWGGLAIPALPGVTFYLDGYKDKELGLLFRITANGPRLYRFEVEGVFNLVEQELQKNSLYRGKAFDGREKPEFIDLDRFDTNRIVYSQAVLDQLGESIFSLIEYPQANRDMDLSLKRAVVLEGPYGTGKTCAAHWTAQKAVANGWTFIMVRPGRDDMLEAFATARLYSPAVVFVEDVDTLVGADGTDGDSVALFLDLFDGVDAKGTEILAVLTTNHVNRIHKGMVRPGRLDALIHIGPLDAAGVCKLAQTTIKAPVADDVDWDAVSQAMVDYEPAFVREALDRAIRFNLYANKGVCTPLTTEDFLKSAEALRAQHTLMLGAPETKPAESLGVALSKTVAQAVHGFEVKVVDGPDEPWAKLFVPESEGADAQA